MSRRSLHAICFVLVFRCRGRFSPLLKPSLNSLPLGDGVLIVIVTARTSPSLRVVYDAHDCFVDRHKKKTAWRLNRSPCNSANTIANVLLTAVGHQMPYDRYLSMSSVSLGFQQGLQRSTATRLTGSRPGGSEGCG